MRLSILFLGTSCGLGEGCGAAHDSTVLHRHNSFTPCHSKSSPRQPPHPTTAIALLCQIPTSYLPSVVFFDYPYWKVLNTPSRTPQVLPPPPILARQIPEWRCPASPQQHSALTKPTLTSPFSVKSARRIHQTWLKNSHREIWCVGHAG